MGVPVDRTTTNDGAGELVDRRSEFPKYFPREAPASYGEFFHAMRDLMDLAVSTDGSGDVYARAAAKIREVSAILEPHVEAGEAEGPACRIPDMPGRGSVLAPPWILDTTARDGLGGTVTFSRFHVGGHAAAHGGTIAHLFDELVGWTMYHRELPIGRTAYLKVDYRSVTPIGVPVRFATRVTRVEGRKVFITGELTDDDGVLLAECDALMVTLRPGNR